MPRGKRADAPPADKPNGKAKAKNPKPGDNNNGKPQALTDIERQALHFRHVSEYESSLAAKKSADADLKNTAKRIKAEGGSMRAVKLTIELRTPEGEDAVRARLAELQEVAQWNGVGIQVDMFADERQPSEDKAFEEGKRAGMKGEPRKPPHDPSVPQHGRWLDGYTEGNAAMASAGFKQLTPVEQAAGSDGIDFRKGDRNGSLGTEPATHRVEA